MLLVGEVGRNGKFMTLLEVLYPVFSKERR
jgi:hypothetical protein